MKNIDRSIQEKGRILRRLQEELARIRFERSFSVFETNADFEEVRSLGSFKNLDIAETVMDKAFKVAGGMTDYMVLDDTSKEIVSYMLSPLTAQRRGECQA